jgi:hypothetical protein
MKCTAKKKWTLRELAPKVNMSLPGAELALSVQRLVTGWMVWGSNLVGVEIFRNRPEQPWGPPSLL